MQFTGIVTLCLMVEHISLIDDELFRKRLKNLWNFMELYNWSDGTVNYDLNNTISEFWADFHCACAETPIYELPVKNLAPPFAPVTSISYKTDIFPLPSNVYGIYSTFLCYYVA